MYNSSSIIEQNRFFSFEQNEQWLYNNDLNIWLMNILLMYFECFDNGNRLECIILAQLLNMGTDSKLTFCIEKLISILLMYSKCFRKNFKFCSVYEQQWLLMYFGYFYNGTRLECIILAQLLNNIVFFPLRKIVFFPLKKKFELWEVLSVIQGYWHFCKYLKIIDEKWFSFIIRHLVFRILSESSMDR